MNFIPEQVKPSERIQHLLSIFQASKAKIRPHFFLTGATGSGKTFMLRSVATQLRLPMIEVSGASITREGQSGNSLSKALSPMKNYQNKPLLVFIDEFDKTLYSSSGVAHDYTVDLQFEFLKVLEEGHIDLFADYGKYTRSTTANCLFIFGGAFQGKDIHEMDDLKNEGIKQEFLGRVNQLIHTQDPELESLMNMVETHPLLDQYLELFDVSKGKAIKSIQDSLEDLFETTPIGVRLVDSAIHSYFLNTNHTKKKVF